MEVVDFPSETSNQTSPRISFSCDLIQADGIPVDRYRTGSSSLLDSLCVDFDFCVGRRTEQETRSADELFSEGMIVPLQFKGESQLSPEKKRENLQEIMAGDAEGRLAKPPEEVTPAGGSSRPFWPFRLSCFRRRRRSFSGARQILSRSSSTGSADSITKRPSSQSGSDSGSSPSPGSSLRKLLLHKASSTEQVRGGSFHKRIRIRPVLNVAPPYIQIGRTPNPNLFGFGFLFFSC